MNGRRVSRQGKGSVSGASVGIGYGNRIAAGAQVAARVAVGAIIPLVSVGSCTTHRLSGNIPIAACTFRWLVSAGNAEIVRGSGVDGSASASAATVAVGNGYRIITGSNSG